MDEAAYSKLCRELDSSALIAGFKSESSRSPNPRLVKESRLWTSAFAVILLTPAEPASSAGLHETWKSAGAWLDGLLVEFENKGQNLDGYAVFALPQKPDEELALAVRQMELDTTVCRKHVIWPEADGSWESRLRAVTPLGLPEGSGTTAEWQAPELPERANAALKSYTAKPDYKHAAADLVKAAETAAKATQEAQANGH